MLFKSFQLYIKYLNKHFWEEFEKQSALDISQLTS